MSFAGHLPTKHFDLTAWQAMPVYMGAGTWAGDGFHRTLLHGRPIVFYNAPVDSGDINFAVRPIVRVKMGRRLDAKQCAKCGSLGMERYCSRC